MEDKQQIKKSHRFCMDDRASAIITGVNDVLSFDANEVLLDTEQGILMIRGEDLHVSRLTLEKGEVDVDGIIDSLSYSNTNNSKNAESFFSRLFK